MSTTLDTLTLDGQQLDYFTGLALGHEMFDGHPYKPSLGGNDMAPILQKMRCIMKGAWRSEWLARADGCNAYATAQTLPVAVCRAVVLGRWGSTVELAGAVDLCEDLF